jgi:putative redox protein
MRILTRMVEMELEYDGGLRCTATHGPSKAQIQTDAPKDNHGKGEAFSPTDLIGVALGTCMMTTMAIVATRHNIELRGAKVRVGKEMVADPTRRIGRLTVEFTLPPGVATEQRQMLENAAHSCPVHKALHGNVDIPVMFRWG